MAGKLDGQKAVITGGASGLGAAIARAYTAAGARVVVLDIDEAGAKRLAAELDGAVAIGCDVTDSAAVDAAFTQAVSELGGLTTVVNNAGIGSSSNEAETMGPRQDAQIMELASGQSPTTPLLAVAELSDDQWHTMISTHLDGVFYCCRAAMRVLGPQGSGSIINMGSVAGLLGLAGAPHYSAAKAGIHGLTIALARDAIISGVRVNAIAPGWIDTPILDNLTEASRAMITLQTPMGRVGRPEEIASTAVFLASEDASFFVGQVVSPNGGLVVG